MSGGARWCGHAEATWGARRRAEAERCGAPGVNGMRWCVAAHGVLGGQWCGVGWCGAGCGVGRLVARAEWWSCSGLGRCGGGVAGLGWRGVGRRGGVVWVWAASGEGRGVVSRVRSPGLAEVAGVGWCGFGVAFLGVRGLEAGAFAEG